MSIKGENHVDEFTAYYRWPLIRWECSALPGTVAACAGALPSSDGLTSTARTKPPGYTTGAAPSRSSQRWRSLRSMP